MASRGPFPAGARGVLHVLAGSGAEGWDGTSCDHVHVSTFVNGTARQYLEDNDIRGFLDGRFKWGWNQASQTTVRLGRDRSPIRPPRYGEDELFRVLQRWTGIELPEGSRVTDATLTLHAREPAEDDRRVYLYPARRDWNPGGGGVRRDNVSVPREGEVWWGEARHGTEPWGLPGAGYASRQDPGADTDAEPLAAATLRAGSRSLELEDARLAGHVDEELREGRPLLFLLKLSDPQEDEPGSLVELLSVEHGSPRHRGLRPILRLEWEPPAGARCRRVELFLEHGRSRVLGPFRATADEPAWATFDARNGFEAPILRFREVDGPDGPPASGWRPLHGPVTSPTGWIEIQAVAARDPVVLGEPYTSRIRDTWVVSAAPEDQEVEWQFVAPSGATHRAAGTYGGDFTWRVEFPPDEIGRWRVRWRHELWGPEETGPWCVFDVVAGDVASARREVRALTRRAEALPRSGPAAERELETFLRLERGAMQGLTPDEFRGEVGRELLRELGEAREALWGREVPGEIPLESHELRREAGERRFEHPIPRNDDHFRDEMYGSRSPSILDLPREVAEWARRLAGRLRRAMRLRADPPSRSRSPGPGEGRAR